MARTYRFNDSYRQDRIDRQSGKHRARTQRRTNDRRVIEDSILSAEQNKDDATFGFDLFRERQDSEAKGIG